MWQKPLIMPCSVLLPLFFALFVCATINVEGIVELEAEDVINSGGFVGKTLVRRREDRRPLMVTEFGEISAVDISSETRGPYHLQFITLEPNSLLLPLPLHADFYVHTDAGSGKLSWADDGSGMRRVNLRKGDVYRLHQGSVFFLRSNLEMERERLRIHAIFSNAHESR